MFNALSSRIIIKILVFHLCRALSFAKQFLFYILYCLSLHSNPVEEVLLLLIIIIILQMWRLRLGDVKCFISGRKR